MVRLFASREGLLNVCLKETRSKKTPATRFEILVFWFQGARQANRRKKEVCLIYLGWLPVTKDRL